MAAMLTIRHLLCYKHMLKQCNKHRQQQATLGYPKCSGQASTNTSNVQSSTALSPKHSCEVCLNQLEAELKVQVPEQSADGKLPCETILQPLLAVPPKHTCTGVLIVRIAMLSFLSSRQGKSQL